MSRHSSATPVPTFLPGPYASSVLGLLLSTILAALLAFAGGDRAFAGTEGFQAEGRYHGGPKAYRAMCARDPALCAFDRDAARQDGTSPAAAMTKRHWDQLQEINMRINQRLVPRDDIDVYGTSDFWTAGRFVGDCEDYMIAKKKALIAAGWSADQLLYAVVVGRQTPYHAVLVVRTDRGDFVLDNLTDRVLPWDVSGYQFVIRQSAADPSRWVRVVAPPRPRDGVRIASG